MPIAPPDGHTVAMVVMSGTVLVNDEAVVRGSQLVWTGEVASEAQTEFSPALLANLAERVADLVVPR